MLTVASRYPLSFFLEISPSVLSEASNISVSEHVYDTMGNRILDFIFYFYNWSKRNLSNLWSFL